MQGEIFGTPEWTLKYSSRSRIEACFSRLKSGDVTPYGRFWARFTDFGKNWLATLLAFVAVNMTEVESYLKRKALRDAGRDDGRKRRIERPRFTDFVRRAVVEPIVSRPAVVGTGPPDRGGGEVVRITSRRDRRRRRRLQLSGAFDRPGQHLVGPARPWTSQAGRLPAGWLTATRIRTEQAHWNQKTLLRLTSEEGSVTSRGQLVALHHGGGGRI